MRIVAALLLLLHTTPAHAHPHVFIDYSVVLPVEPESIEGIGFVFAFDARFSAMIRYTTQSGAPGTASERHAAVLRQLPHEIAVSYNGAPVDLEEPTDLEVAETGGKFTYRFRVPLHTPLSPPGTIDISVQDYGFYAAFAPHELAPVEVKASGAVTATCDRAQAPTGATGQIRCRYGPAGP